MEESLILIATKSLDIILFGPLIDRSDNLNASNILLNDVYSLSSLYSLAMAVDRFVTSLWNLFLSIVIKLLPSSSFHPVTIFILQHFMASIENGTGTTIVLSSIWRLYFLQSAIWPVRYRWLKGSEDSRFNACHTSGLAAST